MLSVVGNIDRTPEDAGEILVKVQDDLRRLKEQLLSQNNDDDGYRGFDLQAIENAIQRTEEGLQKHSEQLIGLSNNTVKTLPALDPRRKQTTSPYPQYSPTTWTSQGYRDKLRPHSTGPLRTGVNKNTGSRLLSRRPGTKPGTGDPYIISPGGKFRDELERKILSDPANSQTRELLHKNYGIQLPLIISRQEKQDLPQKLVRGSTIDQLVVLPRANRICPALNPPPISDDDAQRGLLSLLERGLIPPAAEITLDPSPVRHRQAVIHDYKELYHRRQTPEERDKEEPYHMAGVKLDPNVKSPSESSFTNQLINQHQQLSSRSGVTVKSSVSGSRSLVPVKSMTFEPMPPPVTPSLSMDFKVMEYRFAIQNGIVRDNTPEFHAFRQHYCLQWGSIVTLLGYLKKFTLHYAIPVAFINGDKLAELSQKCELDIIPTTEELLAVMINRDSVEPLIYKPGQVFQGPNGYNMAATKIQATYRRHRDRAAYVKYRKQKWAAGMIAISWIMNAKLSKIRKQLVVTRKVQTEAFRIRNRTLMSQWKRMKTSKRIIVHIPSLGHSQEVRDNINSLNIRQNLQMARLCDLQDPNVEVIYVSPVKINEEMEQYYSKLLGLKKAINSGNTDDQTDLQSRYHILTPEAVSRFPSHNMCLSTLLKYSPKCMQRIKTLTKGKDAYIVPGMVHSDDLSVADYLGLPVLGPEPDLGHLYTTKSGSKRIFASAEVEIPPSEYDVYNLGQLHDVLAQLVTENLNVTRFLLKLDDEFDSRGIAYCDITAHLKCHDWARKQAERYGEKWKKKWAHEPAFHKIHEEVPEILSKHATPVDTLRFPTWAKFLDQFLSKGGVVEACPPSDSVTALSVDVLIEPSGEIKVICQGDQIHADSPYHSWGISVPQSSVDPALLNDATMRIAKAVHSRGVIGYFTVDFVTFIDPDLNEQKLWAVDLNLYYSDHIAMRQLLLYVTNGSLNTDSCLLEVSPPAHSVKPSSRRKAKDSEPPKAVQRYAVMSSRLWHTNLAIIHYSVFFQMCRAHGIGYDIKERQGTVFTLVDNTKREFLGMICLHENLSGSLAMFARNLSVIHQEISAPNMQGETNFKDAIADLEQILGTTSYNEENPNKDVIEIDGNLATTINRQVVLT